MSSLRRLKPLLIPAGKTRRDPGLAPQPLLLKTSQLRINEEYQRQLSRDSARLASKIAVEFDWELYHLLVVSPIDEFDEITGLPLYEVMDGQHTGIAAVTNGNIKELWCWPGRVDESIESRASSFVKLNTQRTAVTPVDLFWAAVKAGEEDPIAVVQACERTGAAVVKRPKPYGDMLVGETICVAPLTKLARIGGRADVERVLKICMNLRMAPIGQAWILAFERLLFKPDDHLHISGIDSTVDAQIENAIERVGMQNLWHTARLQHASASLKEREPVYWWLANLIKQEVDRHVRSQ